jgi:hypothetical protein
MLGRATPAGSEKIARALFRELVQAGAVVVPLNHW